MGLLDQQSYAGYADEGQRLAVKPMSFTPMDAAKFVAEATPIIGDAMAAKEIYDEIQKPDPNYGLVAVLAGASLIGLVPLIGDAAAAPIKKVARGLLDVAKRVEVNPNALGMSGGNVRLRPETGSDFQYYSEKVNPNNVRIEPEQRPNLLMGDMNGMLPKNSELISKQGDVSYYKGSDGNFYATSYNPDLQEQDVVGYISGGSNSTDLSVVKEMQGQGIGGELQYLYRKQNPYAETGGLTEAGEKSLEKTYERLVDEGLLSRAKPKKLPNPKNKAEKTAKEILELRAKGEARYVTDEMMSMADPQYMFNNTPLNMSEGARKLRAEQLGYNKELFHGGQGGIKAMDADIAGGQDYDTGVWSTTDRYNANRYAGSPSENPTAGQSLSTDAFDRYDDKGAVYPLLGKTDNYAKTNFEGANWGDAPKYARMNFKQDGIPTRKKISDMTQDWASWASSPEAARAARTTDSSGLLIKDVVDIGTQFPHPDHIGLSPEMATTAVTFDPTTLRSQFARFDPEFKHLKNLTAAGLLTPSAILALQEYKKQEELQRGLLSY